AQIRELAYRKLSIRPARIPAHERQLAIRRTLRVPLQIMLDLRRLPVFVSAKDRNIEIVARIFEIIGIAAAKRDLSLGGEGQPHVVVTSVAIKMILSALIKCHHV